MTHLSVFCLLHTGYKSPCLLLKMNLDFFHNSCLGCTILRNINWLNLTLYTWQRIYTLKYAFEMSFQGSDQLGEKDFRTALILIFATGTVLLSLNLGHRPLWAVEGRWAEPVREMILSGDYFFPTINGAPRITKPLLPYWMMLASCKIGGINELSVRIPSVLMGLISLILSSLLARKLFDRPAALLAPVILMTSFGFLTYSRLAQCDVFQMTWILAAVTWYVYHREANNFWIYLIFWILADMGALSKGLPGLVIPVAAAGLDSLVRREFTRHLNLKSVSAAVIGLCVYFLPFLITTSHMSSFLPLHLLFKENIMRAFSPFDHMEPFYVYFYYWPALIAPWSIFLLACLWFAVSR